MTIIEKKFDEYSEIKKIPSGLVTYLFKLKDKTDYVFVRKIKIY